MKKKTLLSAVAFVATFGFAGSAMADSTSQWSVEAGGMVTATCGGGSLGYYDVNYHPGWWGPGYYTQDPIMSGANSYSPSGSTSVTNSSFVNASFTGGGQLSAGVFSVGAAEESATMVHSSYTAEAGISAVPGCNWSSSNNVVSSIGGSVAHSAIGTARSGFSFIP